MHYLKIDPLELDLKKFILEGGGGVHVLLYSFAETPPAFGLIYEGAIGQPR